MCGSHDRHVGPEHNCLANSDQAAVQDRKIEVSVEARPYCQPYSHSCCSCLLLPVAYADVASVVHTERRLDENILSHMPHQLFKLDEAVCSHCVEVGVRVFGEGGVVFVAPAAGLEAGCVEFGCECIVAIEDRESA